MDERLVIAQMVGSYGTLLALVGGLILAAIKWGPERQSLATEASQAATSAMATTMQELRASVAEQKEKSATMRAELAQQRERAADARRESIEKDIEHSKTLKAQQEQIETMRTDARTEREGHEKREKELTTRIEKLEKELADTQAKWQAKYDELEAQYKAVVAENERLRDRVKALEGAQEKRQEAAQEKPQEAQNDEKKG